MQTWVYVLDNMLQIVNLSHITVTLVALDRPTVLVDRMASYADKGAVTGYHYYAL